MKAVLISIQPKWVDEIAYGEKRIEVRKTRPKLQTPFKVYIYCTKPYTGSTDDNFYIYPNDTPKRANGKVVGEFVCDRIGEYANGEIALSHNTDETCLTNCELADYIEGSKAYFWHISDLKIYDKPKELSEFKKHYECGKNSCGSCDKCDKDWNLKRPPQSWCYVEELKE